MFSQEDQISGLILAINPRIPFTRIGVTRNNQVIFLKKVKHDEAEIKKAGNFSDQTEFRTKQIFDELEKNDISIKDIKIIITGGGLLKPVKAGIYEINNSIKKDLKIGYSGDDVLNLGGLIADRLKEFIPGSRAFVSDPVSVDEFEDIARISGHPAFERKSVFHALKHKSVAYKHARTISKDYNELNLIVGYFGNGITIGAHRKGKVIDATQGLDGDGPFSVSRSGGLPAGDLVRHCYSGKFTIDETLAMISQEGGLAAYMGGLHDGFEVNILVEKGNEKAMYYFKAMAYQALKCIGSMYAVLKGEVDAIVLTGGLLNSEFFLNELREGLNNFPPVHVYPMEDLMESLAKNGFRLLTGESDISDY